MGHDHLQGRLELGCQVPALWVLRMGAGASPGAGGALQEPVPSSVLLLPTVGT